MPVRAATARPVQCVTSSGGSEQVSANTFATVRVECGGVPGGRVLSRSKPSTPFLGKALLPAPNGRSADASLSSHVLHAQAFGGEQDDARPQDVLEGAGSISGDRGTALTS